jgi:acyl carrier protein
MSVRERLVAFIESTDTDVPDDLQADTSLIRSGLFDSLALFQLFLWMENELDAPVDPLSVDLAEEWDTVDDIVRFVEARRP